MGMRDEQRIQRARAYREANRDHINETRRRWRAANLEKAHAQQARYRANHRDEIREADKQYKRKKRNTTPPPPVRITELATPAWAADDPAVFLAEAVAIPASGSTPVPLPADDGGEAS